MSRLSTASPSVGEAAGAGTRPLDPDTCASCGAALDGPYCSLCGERTLRPDEFRLRRFAADLMEEVTGGPTSRLRRTLHALAMKPGRLTREWVNGRRRPYVTPIQVFLLANLVYFFVQPLTTYQGYVTTLGSQLDRQMYSEMLDLRTPVAERIRDLGLEVGTYQQLYDLQAGNLARTLVILMVPLLAGLLALLLARQRRPFTHHLAFALHYYAWELVFIASFFLLAWGHLLRGTVAAIAAAGADPAAIVANGGPLVQLAWAFLSEWSTSPLILAYLYLAIRRFYGPSRGRALLLAAAATVALPFITLAYRFLLFWITLATV